MIQQLGLAPAGPPVWPSPAISGGTFGFQIDTVADVALRTVRDHLLGETGIERVAFVLRGDALDAFARRLSSI